MMRSHMLTGINYTFAQQTACMLLLTSVWKCFSELRIKTNDNVRSLHVKIGNLS
jgi:hypothetical protein